MPNQQAAHAYPFIVHHEISNLAVHFLDGSAVLVGIVSGGATREIHQAVDERLDLYITGESSHSMYHLCFEESINLLAGGHYQTETFGVKSMEELLSRETDVETIFIDVPTGM